MGSVSSFTRHDVGWPYAGDPNSQNLLVPEVDLDSSEVN
jgi:hypothetical protein